MNIIGIDPGYDRCGIAVLHKDARTETLVYSTCVQTHKGDTFIQRLCDVTNAVDACIRTHAPDALAIETLVFNKNQKTAMHVAEVRGAILYTAHTHGVPVFEYTPQQIKSAVAGSGAGSKTDVTRMIHMLLKLPAQKRLDDEYDAIAAALVHSAVHR
jgi:crossover junction endodeoxyribonuclease RuvC